MIFVFLVIYLSTCNSFLHRNHIDWRMKSITQFFPVVGETVKNKRQKITETAYAAISTKVSDVAVAAEKGPDQSASAIESPEKGPATAAAVIPSIPASSSTAVPPLAWKPFEDMEVSWKSRLHPEYNKPYFQRLLAFLQSELKSQTIFPPTNQIFTALNLCPYDNVKVVIIGQDPYHGDGQAHGLAFSVQKGQAPPPSLKNMFKELQSDPKIEFPKPTHGNLEHWSRQGVILLNAVLTVRRADANSHQKKGYDTCFA
jgi:hypothetical protein